MYLYDFLNSLDELRKDTVPSDDFPKEKVIYQKSYKRKKEIKNGKFVQYIGYYQENDFDHLYTQYIVINKYVSYIHRLRKIQLDLRSVRMSDIDSAIHEAIVLFDAFAHMNINPYISCELYDGAETILYVYDHPKELSFFQGNPLKRDIFTAQFEYFVKKYLSIKLKRPIVSQHKGMSLSLKMRNSLVTYQNNEYLLDMNPNQNHQEIKEFLNQL